MQVARTELRKVLKALIQESANHVKKTSVS